MGWLHVGKRNCLLSLPCPCSSRRVPLSQQRDNWTEIEWLQAAGKVASIRLGASMVCGEQFTDPAG